MAVQAPTLADQLELRHGERPRVEAQAPAVSAVDNLMLVEPDEWEICCGSAGTYNIEKPDTAAELGERKARNLLDTGAQMIATGNIGCMTQVQTHLRAMGHDIPVMHTFQLLDRAYGHTG